MNIEEQLDEWIEEEKAREQKESLEAEKCEYCNFNKYGNPSLHIIDNLLVLHYDYKRYIHELMFEPLADNTVYKEIQFCPKCGREF